VLRAHRFRDASKLTQPPWPAEISTVNEIQLLLDPQSRCWPSRRLGGVLLTQRISMFAILV